MPVYEYECQKCGTFETTQRITEEPLSKCPTCKGKVKKLISNTSFQLKGTGWYITDYARKGKEAPKTENGASSSSSESKESKNDSKETKTETKKESAPAKSESSSTSSTTT
ncbi:MAG TPA: FmdB family zinc ribbon protein [Candidatus Polarisedimenticolaceae bacterium]|jgi:putative FmdB family regulatory protein|nr:FmdB family zinc ribbon protein [Candidatus Polarisedimenticolaceae bacterium]